MGAVEAEPVDPAGGRVAVVARSAPEHQPAEQEAAQAEAGGVVELGDRLVGVVGRDDTDGEQPVVVGGVRLGVVAVARAGDRSPQLAVVHRHHGQAEGGVEDRDVDADLVEPIVQQTGEHGGGAIEGVAGRHAPPARAGQAEPPAVLCVEATPERTRRQDHIEAVDHRTAGVVAHQVTHDRDELEDVAVGIHDGVVEVPPDVSGSRRRATHEGASSSSR